MGVGNAVLFGVRRGDAVAEDEGALCSLEASPLEHAARMAATVRSATDRLVALLATDD